MQADFRKSFKKAYKKLDIKVQSAFDSRLDIFYDNPFHPLLNNHSLTGKYQGFRSINITGDVRAIYKQVDETTAVFIALGTHSELYKS